MKLNRWYKDFYNPVCSFVKTGKKVLVRVFFFFLWKTRKKTNEEVEEL